MIVAANLWGPTWASSRVEFLCDNEVVVSILKSGTSRDPHLMALFHYLYLLPVQYSSFTSSVQGKNNPIADSLSLFQFQTLAPLADRESTPIPPSCVSTRFKEIVCLMRRSEVTYQRFTFTLVFQTHWLTAFS